jgi:hypothetical protein
MNRRSGNSVSWSFRAMAVVPAGPQLVNPKQFELVHRAAKNDRAPNRANADTAGENQCNRARILEGAAAVEMAHYRASDSVGRMNILAKAVEKNVWRHRLSGARSVHKVLAASVALALIYFLPVLTCDAAEVRRNFVLDFSGYTGGAVDDGLRARHFTFEKDAKNRRLLQLSVGNYTLTLEAKGHLSGFLLNDAVNVEKITRIRINWGIIRYPVDVSYRKVNNEALMLYVFFGTEKISSGHVLIPNSPYFIGLFLCQDEQIDFPYKGRYFHTSSRFVCLGKPKPNETIVSEFDLDTAFKRYFDKNRTPGITGIGSALIPPRREGVARRRRLSSA